MDFRSKISAVISQLCTVLLSLLGYNCSSSPFDEPGLMYGSPYSTFELKGTVTNEEGQPVNDAEIVVSTPWAIANWGTKPTILWESFAKTVSNGEGAYFLNKTYWTDSLKIICAPAGNAYQADSVKVETINRLRDGFQIKNFSGDFPALHGASRIARLQLLFFSIQ